MPLNINLMTTAYPSSPWRIALPGQWRKSACAVLYCGTMVLASTPVEASADGQTKKASPSQNYSLSPEQLAELLSGDGVVWLRAEQPDKSGAVTDAVKIRTRQSLRSTAAAQPDDSADENLADDLYAQAVAAAEEERNLRSSNPVRAKAARQKFWEHIYGAAHAGSADAQACMWRGHYRGRAGGPEEDHAKARYWAGRAAAQGHIFAMHAFAYMCRHGEGGPKDLKEATRWYRQAYQGGRKDSGVGLAILLFDDVKTYPARFESIAILLELATDGNTDAQAVLAGAYQADSFQGRNIGEAVRWAIVAGEKCPAGTQHSVGWHYWHGQDISQDASMAVTWWRKAAAKGYAPSQWALGFAYAKGIGAPRSTVDAQHWFKLAAEQNFIPRSCDLSLLSTGFLDNESGH